MQDSKSFLEIIAIIFILSLCLINSDEAASETSNLNERIQVPSDSRASYFLIKLAARKSGDLEITTKRLGPSGTSYSVRLVRCSPLSFGYIADGESVETLKRDEAPKLSSLVGGSISDVISRYACNKAGKPIS